MSLLPEISQASAEINKLVAQANIHQTIAPVNPAAFTDPADTMLLASRDPVIREVSVGMTGVEAVQNTVSGTPPLSLPNSLGKPLKAWSVDVLPKQDLHGYDNPWPAGGGKNLVNYLACVGLGARSNDDTVFYTTTAVDGILTLTGDASYVHGGMIFKGIGAPTPPTTFTVSAEVKSTSTRIIFGIGAYEGGGTSAVDTNLSVTTNTWVKISRTYSNVSYGKIGIFLQPQRDEDVLQVKNVQLESGTTATDYAPYSNICPILGTDKLNLFVEESYDPSATPKAVLTLPQTVYTGTIGSEGGESRWGEVDLGTITWNAHGSLPNVYSGWGQNIPRWKILPPLGVANALCSEYKITTSAPGGVDAIDFSIALGTGGSTSIYVHNSAVADIDEFRTAISGVQLTYELETPVPFAVTAPTIPTPTGSSTTWATAEDGTVESMEVTYVGKA